jgi:hypothetical protein
MYIVISMPNRISMACGVSHVMVDLLWWLSDPYSAAAQRPESAAS